MPDPIIETVQTVNASTSEKDYLYDNLNFKAQGVWRSEAGQELPQWLNFDLQRNYVLTQIRLIATNRESAPKHVAVDYFGNDLRIIGRNITELSFNASSPNYTKYQEFPITYDEKAVKYVRLRILSNHGADFVQINNVIFFGKESMKGVKQVANTPDEDPPYIPQQWYVGDRVRYRWQDLDPTTGRPGALMPWSEGRILHINEGNNPTDPVSYLIKDDSGWVKDGIAPRNVREPRYRRKPRKLKASCPEISLKPIVEELEQEIEEERRAEESSDDPVSDMEDARNSDEEKTTSPTKKQNKPLSLDPAVKRKAPVERSNSSGKAPVERSNSSGSQGSISPRRNQTSPRNAPISSSSSPKRSPPSPSNRTRRSQSHGSGGNILKHRNKIICTGFANDRLNGTYNARSSRQGGRPTFRNAENLVIWWYHEVKTWMISQANLVGSDKSYSCVRDNAYHPCDIKARWKTYNKKRRAWDPDPTARISTSDASGNDDERIGNENNDEDDVTLEDLRRMGGEAGDKKRKGSGEVLWRVRAQNFRLSKLNGSYTRTEARKNGRHVFVKSQPDGRELVLWWYKRRKFWMVSPKKMVGTDKSYACIQHSCLHPKDINGNWQVFDTTQRRFTDDNNAEIVAGEVDSVVLTKFLLKDINGNYVETGDISNDRPMYKNAKAGLLLWYKLGRGRRHWWVSEEGAREVALAMVEDGARHPSAITGTWHSKPRRGAGGSFRRNTNAKCQRGS